MPIFAYDPVRGRLYCIKEDFPYPTDGGVNWIAGSNTLFYLDIGDSFDLLFGDEVYTWNKIAALDTGTGHARNHNAGIVQGCGGSADRSVQRTCTLYGRTACSRFPRLADGRTMALSLHTYVPPRDTIYHSLR